MFTVGNISVDNAVAKTTFCCDIARCKGFCCVIEGGRGAPLEDEELFEIEKAYPVVKRFLNETSIRAIETMGLHDGAPGNYATVCIEGKECAFACFEDDIARCSYEKAFVLGLTGWRKPLSCHLFPLRVRGFRGDSIHFEPLAECQPARDHGSQLTVRLHEFVKEPLVTKFGKSWYGMLARYCDSQK